MFGFHFTSEENLHLDGTSTDFDTNWGVELDNSICTTCFIIDVDEYPLGVERVESNLFFIRRSGVRFVVILC